jgi:iron-sulfur cluster assembly accessory protein
MIHISEAAINEFLRLRAKTATLPTNLRLGVELGGCAGLVYTLAFDHTVAADDQVFKSDRLPVVVNSQDLDYLIGLTLDYTEDLMGGAFQFRNPQATGTCSCGTSFSIPAK